MSPSYVTKLLRTPLFRFSTYRFLFLVTFALALFLFPQNVYSVDVTLAWSENSEEDLDGYRLFWRQEGQSYDYSDPEWEGSETTCTIYNLNDNTTYYFVTRAFDTSGNESGDSNEACYQPNVDVPGVILDTGDAGTSSSGSWSISGGTNPYGDKSLYSKTAGATYTFTAAVEGYYEVSLWWTEWSSRCTSVPVKIYDGYTLLDTVYVNQKANGSQWNVLGIYDFSGTARVRIISEGSSCSTCADAVRFVPDGEPELEHIEIEGPVSVNETSANYYNCRAFYTNGTNRLVEPHTWDVDCVYAEISTTGLLTTNEIDSDEPCQIFASYIEGGMTRTDTYDIIIRDFGSPTGVILDNGGAGTSYTGTWNVSGGANPYGDKSLYSKTAGATYTFTASAEGYYEVSLWWTEWSSRCTSVPVKIYDGYTLLDTVYVDQQANGGQWNVIGIYDFSGTARVRIISEDSSCSTCADAVRFVPGSEGVILDTGDAGTSSSGTWKVSGGTNPYGDSSLYSKTAGATYTFTAAVEGYYEVSLWWTQWPSRCTSVPVKIYDGYTLLDTVYVDQQADGGQWNVIGIYDFSGTARVRIISEDSSCSTCADAVRFVP